MVTKAFTLNRPIELSDTAIDVWQERDRLTIALYRKSTGKYLMRWVDDDAREAIEDGFLDASETVLGNLARFARHGGRLHVSAFNCWQRTKE